MELKPLIILKLELNMKNFYLIKIQIKEATIRDYNKMFTALNEFGWKPIMENKNIIGLKKNGKNITLEPGNQIELSGDKLNNIHEACQSLMITYLNYSKLLKNSI